MAAVMSLIVFALCLVVGGLEAGNPFTTTVRRALVAMVGTLIIGLVVGAGFRAMLRENLVQEEKKLKLSSGSPTEDDRQADRAPSPR